MQNTNVRKEIKILVVRNTDGETIKDCKSSGQVCTNADADQNSKY